MNEIKLKIGGVEYNFTLGLGFLGDVLENTDLKLEDITTKILDNPFKWIPTIMFYSARSWAELEGKEFTITIKSIIESLSKENGQINCKQSHTFVKELTRSLIKNVPTEEVNDEEVEGDEKKN